MSALTEDMIDKHAAHYERALAYESLIFSKLDEMNIGEIIYLAAAPYEDPLAALSRIRRLSKKFADKLGINILVKASGDSIRIRRMPPGSKGPYSEWLNLNMGQSDTVFEGRSYDNKNLKLELEKARRLVDKLFRRGEGKFETWIEDGEVLVRKVRGVDGPQHGWNDRWKNLKLPVQSESEI